jgi:prepilin peptidase CpaA
MSMIIVIIACIYMSIAFYTDIRWMIIPNWLTLSAAAVGIMVQVLLHHWAGLLASVLGLMVCFALTLGLYAIKGIGAGDVKGIAALGAIMGLQFTLYVLAVAFIYAGIVGAFILAFRGTIPGLLRHWWGSMICYWITRQRAHLRIMVTHQVHSFPFMIAVLPAFITCLLFV